MIIPSIKYSYLMVFKKKKKFLFNAIIEPYFVKWTILHQYFRILFYNFIYLFVTYNF